jgi:hypothetical protein
LTPEIPHLKLDVFVLYSGEPSQMVKKSMLTSTVSTLNPIAIILLNTAAYPKDRNRTWYCRNDFTYLADDEMSRTRRGSGLTCNLYSIVVLEGSVDIWERPTKEYLPSGVETEHEYADVLVLAPPHQRRKGREETRY